MHVVDRTDTFTLVGGDARRGKLTFFAAEAPRERGVLERIVVRVPRLGDTRRVLGEAGYASGSAGNGAELVVDGPDGVTLGVVEDERRRLRISTMSCSPCPTPTRRRPVSASSGWSATATGSPWTIVTSCCARATPTRAISPLLNHLAFLVASADRVEQEARSRGLDIENVVDAPNTLAVFLRGPDRIRLEYVEHKPGFSLV